MLTIATRQSASGEPRDRLVLPFDLRQKSRLRARLASGREVALHLERGGVLRGGDQLVTTDGLVILVVAADEPVSRISADDAVALARAAYHLGNRHVPLEIGPGWLQYEHDHVLDHMVAGLGLQVMVATGPFEPEAGAYGSEHGPEADHVHQHHGHGHGHGHHHHHHDD